MCLRHDQLFHCLPTKGVPRISKPIDTNKQDIVLIFKFLVSVFTPDVWALALGNLEKKVLHWTVLNCIQKQIYWAQFFLTDANVRLSFSVKTPEMDGLTLQFSGYIWWGAWPSWRTVLGKLSQKESSRLALVESSYFVYKPKRLNRLHLQHSHMWRHNFRLKAEACMTLTEIS